MDSTHEATFWPEVEDISRAPLARRLGDPEHPFDVGQCPYSDLNVGFGFKPAAGLECVAFGEQPAHGVERRFALLIQGRVEMADRCAIKSA